MERIEDKFTGLYRQHYEQVARYVRRRVAPDAVRDVTADVFLVVWRRFVDVPAEDPLPWLYGVARLTVSNHVRSSRRSVSLTQRLFSQPPQPPADLADSVVTQIVISDAFGRIREQDREVLRLIAWEQLSPKDAAVVLGCSKAAFGMKLHRARRNLRHELQRSEADLDAFDDRVERLAALLA